jgi:hypothetical protein
LANHAVIVPSVILVFTKNLISENPTSRPYENEVAPRETSKRAIVNGFEEKLVAFE